ncbi:bifunctional diguanylate cyclase/phosphodiesterase [Rheinheimera sp.]|jgi:diguanylate cyclase (GGDEF)-like protein|uniref:putative bifunctional diguanylate cyclase/phosphodiesterase n=1 Tax=Rheinheimera sp. TaxID=1869214 RepID=UPI002624DF71|nr:EAL domain-containing protein [Rheinheimera sp.]MCA1929981.1 EAL domain-containing protein [Rheinheimera sp.]
MKQWTLFEFSAGSDITALTATQLKRLKQIVWICLIAVLCGSVFSGPKSVAILLTTAVGLICILVLLQKLRIGFAIGSLLWLLTLMICSLISINLGIFDLMLLGYPLVLAYAAMYSGRRFYLLLFGFILLFCSGLALATLYGWLEFSPPRPSFNSFITLNILLLVCGLTMRLIARDTKDVLLQLKQENERVVKSQLEIQRLAQHDPLTGLVNRTQSELGFQRAMAAKPQGPVALLFIDLDNFKPVNDALGHQAGDQVLRQLAVELQSQLSEQDVLSRFGGDEFVVIVTQWRDEAELEQRIQRLLQSCQQEFVVLQHKVQLSASIGAVVAPQDGTDFHLLCKKADTAMYQAKKMGRNRFCWYHADMERQQLDKFNLMMRLRVAVKQQLFSVAYQPSYDLKTGSISGAEALLRWSDAELGVVPPDVFIPLAEQTGLIQELGLFVLQRACAQALLWQQSGFSIGVAVNLSAMQFKQGDLPEVVMQVLRQTGLPPHLLELELTESVLIDDTALVKQQIEQLSAAGVRFAIDDFGTGYSNLGYLSQFSLSSLKIDRSFVARIRQNDKDLALVKGIIQLASSLGLHTVAEGVEDNQSLELLQQAGCGCAQGYLWSKAVSPREFNLLLGQ